MCLRLFSITTEAVIVIGDIFTVCPGSQLPLCYFRHRVAKQDWIRYSKYSLESHIDKPFTKLIVSFALWNQIWLENSYHMLEMIWNSQLIFCLNNIVCFCMWMSLFFDHFNPRVSDWPNYWYINLRVNVSQLCWVEVLKICQVSPHRSLSTEKYRY